MQIQPAKDLSGIVKHYLILKTDSVNTTLRFFSDGNTGVVFSAGDKMWVGYGDIAGQQSLPEAFVYGQISSFKDITCKGKTSLFIIVFHPNGLNKLLNIPAAELKDEIVPFADLFGQKNNITIESIALSNTTAEKIIIAERFLRQALTKQPVIADKFMTASITFILKNKGLVTVNNLVKFSGYHERHIERRFKSVVGLSPKRYCNIVRLHAFLKEVKYSINQSPVNCAYAAGYYDQAHLIREFKSITGITPAQYTAKSKLLAVNFLTLEY